MNNANVNFACLGIEDIDAIYNLQQKNSFLDGYNKQMLLDGFSKGGLKCVGVFENSQLIAFLTYSNCYLDAEIQDILVDKNFRRKGYAQLLINWLIKETKNNKIFLEVRRGNINAINLYKKCNFKAVNIRKKYYSDGEDACIMCLEL